jgi:hypothetical protein
MGLIQFIPYPYCLIIVFLTFNRLHWSGYNMSVNTTAEQVNPDLRYLFEI